MEEDIKGGVDTFMYSERLHNFCRNFSKLGRIIFYRTEYIPSQHSSDINSLQHWIDYISYNLNTKINNMRSRHPSTSVIVVGWSVSASIAYKLYLFNPKNIQCLILINFPTQTNTNEIKKFTQSQINNTHCPILFVTGSESSISKTEDIERLRNSLQCPTGFIRAKHCDDVLNLPPKYKLMMNIPQDIVDMKITEKISNFIRHHYCGDRIESTNAELSQNEDSDSDDTIFSTILLENGR
uniref:Protein sumv-2 (Trinotate prediction) n=1 Tax=Henneguya salminicola TaxID=69463 RepID=A0A6G3MEW9_HENSL